MEKETIFKNWNIKRHIASSPCGEYHIWISNGFSFFDDFGNNTKPFLTHLGIWDRYKLWRELKRERVLRAKKIIKSYE